MLQRKTLLAILAATTFSAALAHADVRLPKVFGTHMVLQADKPPTVWGWAQPGEDVTATLNGATAKATATDRGEFRLTLPAQKASSAATTLTLTGKNTVTLDDVLVGEVWLCSGQSNMEMGVKMVKDADKEIAAGDHPGIRLFYVPKSLAGVPQTDVNAEWKVCSPDALANHGGWGGFSATAYFFGRELHDQLKVPVGLLHSSWGGTRIEPWTPPVGFAGYPSLKAIDIGQQLADPRSDLHKSKVADYLRQLNDWSAAAKTATDEGKPLPGQPKLPEGLNFREDAQTPTALYNAMIHPLIPFSLRGAIWYQGESNHEEGTLYVDKTRAMVDGWRKLFGQGDFPYYFVQIAPYTYGNENPRVLAEFWEAQAAIPAVLKNSGMVVTNDISEIYDIHPHNKQEVGRRLALQALNKTYGKTDIVADGPTFKSLATEGNTLKVVFDHAEGLKSRDGKPLTNFEIIGGDEGGFVPAVAEIQGNTVLLKADGVKKPVAVRFGWSKIAEPNLSNAAGLPAATFRAGNAPDRDLVTMSVPELKDYKLAYDLNLTKLKNDDQGPLSYTTNNTAALSGAGGAIDRIAYCLELTDTNDKKQFVWVSLDAFTQDLKKIAVPTPDAGAMFQQGVTNLHIFTNVAGVATGNIAAGNIEFWPSNYGSENSAKIPGASDQAYDFGDMPSGPTEGHGSMQIHNTAAKQTVFALNKWHAGSGAEMGIGNQPKGNPDWTFAENASQFPERRLRVFVKMK